MSVLKTLALGRFRISLSEFVLKFYFSYFQLDDVVLNWQFGTKRLFGLLVAIEFFTLTITIYK